MTYAFNEYEERCRFDAFCKVVLRHKAIDYFRELSRQRKREIQFNTLSQYEMDKLCTLDDYPSDSLVFSAFGYGPTYSGRAGGRGLCHLARAGTENSNSALCVGIGRRRDWRLCGNVPQHCTTAQNKDAE